MATGSGRRRPRVSNPIGVFDSGLGGLTVVREIRRRLPSESIVYFGDIARLPYGIKSKEQILSYSIQNTLFLVKRKVKAVVIACNSSSSAAFRFLKNHFRLPVIDVIEPAVQSAFVGIHRNGVRIGVLATSSTIATGAYEKAIHKKDPSAKVFQMACPLFVPLVEEGWREGKIVRDIVKYYLRPIKRFRPESLILGCTHYPLLRPVIQREMGPAVRLIDSAKPTVEKLSSLLNENELSYPDSRRGFLKIYVSDLPRNFIRVGETFLGEKLHHVELVRQK
ncbi:MAG: glutamate racemase [Candidatus Omnitrophica bacterium]|nr:glutamate racemase [Candidatus Omnitrophota bacterium]